MKKIILTLTMGLFLLMLGCTENNTEGNINNETDVQTGSQTDDINGQTDNNDDSGSFAECITNTGAIFYGSENCGHCTIQKNLFEDDFNKINYVSCLENRQACTDAGITAYPTWDIDGKKHLGRKTLEELSTLTGCKLD